MILTRRPLFPGYMFVAFDRKNMPWHKINNTLGVSKLLTLNNEPYIIPKTLITNMMAQCDLGGIFHPERQFTKGDSVRFISGPFDSFLATVENIDKNQRVWVLIGLMGQSTRTIIKIEKLKSVCQSIKLRHGLLEYLVKFS